MRLLAHVAWLVSSLTLAYTVFGFRAGTLDTVRLQIESLKAKASLVPFGWQERMMRGYTVEAEGFDFLERRFNVVGVFQDFVLLDEIAIEACNEFHVLWEHRSGLWSLRK